MAPRDCSEFILALEKRFFLRKKLISKSWIFFNELSHFFPELDNFDQKFSQKILTNFYNGIYLYNLFLMLNSNQFAEMSYLS